MPPGCIWILTIASSSSVAYCRNKSKGGSVMAPENTNVKSTIADRPQRSEQDRRRSARNAQPLFTFRRKRDRNVTTGFRAFSPGRILRDAELDPPSENTQQ